MCISFCLFVCLFVCLLVYERMHSFTLSLFVKISKTNNNTHCLFAFHMKWKKQWQQKTLQLGCCSCCTKTKLKRHIRTHMYSLIQYSWNALNLWVVELFCKEFNKIRVGVKVCLFICVIATSEYIVYLYWHLLLFGRHITKRKNSYVLIWQIDWFWTMCSSRLFLFFYFDFDFFFSIVSR